MSCTGPAVTADMLPNPPANDMQTVGNAHNTQQRQVAARQNLDIQPNNFGRQNEQSNGSGNNSNSNQPGYAFALLCVLCFGSVSGNAFLFWSYLDVRSKYQGMVHGSPSRRNRYDD